MNSGVKVMLDPLEGVASELVGAGRFEFQCGPLEDLTVDYGYEHTNYTTLGAGEMSRPYGRKLRTVSFETLFVPEEYSWVNTDIANHSVSELTTRLRNICENGDPFYLQIASTPTTTRVDDGVSIAMAATLRSVKFSQKAGEPDTVYASVSFSEYLDWDGATLTQTVSGGLAGNKKGGAPKTPLLPATVRARYSTRHKKWEIRITDSKKHSVTKKLREPLTLGSVSKDFYGKHAGHHWKDIRTKSGLGRWGVNTSLGTNSHFKNKWGVLHIPALPKPKKH